MFNGYYLWRLEFCTIDILFNLLLWQKLVWVHFDILVVLKMKSGIIQQNLILHSNGFQLVEQRWNSAHQYKSKQGVADSSLNVTNNFTTTPRSDIFITNKIGAGETAMGYIDNVSNFIHGLQITALDPTCKTVIHPTIIQQFVGKIHGEQWKQFIIGIL